MIIYISIVQSVVICIFAKLIIVILYGRAYMEAVLPLRIVAWYTIFSYLGPVRNIWILAEEKQKYLWVINLSGALVSIVLNFMFIPDMGVSGAAFAALVTQIFTNVLIGYFIQPIRECNKLMFRSLHPRNLDSVIKILIKS